MRARVTAALGLTVAAVLLASPAFAAPVIDRHPPTRPPQAPPGVVYVWPRGPVVDHRLPPAIVCKYLPRFRGCEFVIGVNR